MDSAFILRNWRGGGGEEQTKPIINIRKEINNIEVEINEWENRKIIEKINYISSQTDVGKNDKNQMNNIRNARNRFNTNLQMLKKY